MYILFVNNLLAILILSLNAQTYPFAITIAIFFSHLSVSALTFLETWQESNIQKIIIALGTFTIVCES